MTDAADPERPRGGGDAAVGLVVSDTPTCHSDCSRMVSSGGDRCELGTRRTQIAEGTAGKASHRGTANLTESYVGGGDAVVVVVVVLGTRAMVMLTALPIFTRIPAAGR